MKITSKHIFRIFCILYIGYLILPIVFANIFWPLKSSWFYIYGWIALLIFFKPQVLVSKPLFFIYFMYLVFTLLLVNMGIDEEFGRIYGIFTYIFIAISMMQYFLMEKDFTGLKLVIQFALVSIIITMITSLIGLQQFPLAARNSAGILQRDGQFELLEYYNKRGIASYDFFYGLAYIIPFLASFLKLELKKKVTKLTIFLLILLVIFSIIQSQYTTPTLMAILGLIMSYWSPDSIHKTFYRYGLLVVVFFVLLTPITNLLFFVTNLVPGVTISSRLYDVGGLMLTGYGNSSLEVVARVSRIPFQFGNFISSPFVGGFESTGHVFWFDILAEFGLLGIIPLTLLIVDQIKRNIQYMSVKDWKYYFISMFLFFLTGIFRNIGGSTMSLIVFFILPSLMIVKYKLVETKKNGTDV